MKKREVKLFGLSRENVESNRIVQDCEGILGINKPWHPLFEVLLEFLAFFV